MRKWVKVTLTEDSPIKPGGDDADSFGFLAGRKIGVKCSAPPGKHIPHDDIESFIEEIDSAGGGIHPHYGEFDERNAGQRDSLDDAWETLLVSYSELVGIHMDRLREELTNAHRQFLDQTLQRSEIDHMQLDRRTAECMRAALLLRHFKQECLFEYDLDHACIAFEAYKAVEIESKRIVGSAFDKRRSGIERSVIKIRENLCTPTIYRMLKEGGFFGSAHVSEDIIGSIFDKIDKRCTCNELLRGMINVAVVMGVFGRDYVVRSSVTGKRLIIQNPLGLIIKSERKDLLRWLCGELCKQQRIRNKLVHSITEVPRRTKTSKMDAVVDDCVNIINALQCLEFE